MLSTTDPRLSKVKPSTPGDVSLPPTARLPLDAPPFAVSLSRALLGSAKSARPKTVSSRLPDAKPGRLGHPGSVNPNRASSLNISPRPDPTPKRAQARHAHLEVKRGSDQDPTSEPPAQDPDENRAGRAQPSPAAEGMAPAAFSAPARIAPAPPPPTPQDPSASDSVALASVVVPFPFPYPRRDLGSELRAEEENSAEPLGSGDSSGVIVPLFPNSPAVAGRGLVPGADPEDQQRASADENKIIPLPMLLSNLRAVESEADVRETPRPDAIEAVPPAADAMPPAADAMVATDRERREPGSESSVISLLSLPDASREQSAASGERSRRLDPERSRSGVVGVARREGEAGAGEIKIDNVIQLFSIAENGRDPSRRGDGTGGAKSSVQMKNAEGTSHADKLGEQTLPPNGPIMSPTADNALSSTRSGNGGDGVSADRVSTSMGLGVVSAGERSRSEATTAPAEVKPPTNPEQIQHKLANCAVELKRFKADSMSVVLKPDPNTEVYLHLTLNQGWVDVETQLKRGDLAALQGQWGQVQEALSRQGVRVGPLQGADSPAFSNLDSGGSSAGSGREQNPSPEPPVVPSGKPIFVSTTPASHSKTLRPARAGERSWESWA